MNSLELALLQLKNGNARTAQKTCSSFILDQPDNADAWHIHGMTLEYLMQYEEAADSIGNAIKLAPTVAMYHNNLGLVLWKLGQLPEAEASCRQALRLNPQYAQAHCNLGNALHDQGRWTEAASCYLDAIRWRPDYAKALSNLGETLRELRQLDEAERCCRQAIDLQPDYAIAHCNLGNALWSQGKPIEAINAYREAIQHSPHYMKVLCNLVGALLDARQIDEALAVGRNAVETDPTSAEAHERFATALHASDQWQQAEQHYRKALTLDPTHIEALSNLGNLLRDMGRFAEAMRCYERVVGSNTTEDWIPNAPQEVSTARYHLSLLQLQSGDFANGWANYEYRLSLEDKANSIDQETRQLSSKWQPNRWAYFYNYFDERFTAWSGEPLSDSSIIVWAEQGVGDEVMFASVLPDLIASAGRCVVVCDPRLVPLYCRSFKEVTFMPFGRHLEEVANDIKFHVPIGTLPKFYRQRAESFASTRYLLSCDKQTENCRDRYASFGSGLKVGISWKSGNRMSGARRSAPLVLWKDVLSVDGVQFINVQYGDCAEQLEAIRSSLGVHIHQDNSVDPLVDLDAFASQLHALDLVISVDNSTVHFAGALGVPVWNLLAAVPNWRWPRQGHNSLWYKCMRLFHQSELSCWEPLLKLVADQLKTYKRNSAAL